MRSKLSLLLITYNCEELIKLTLDSCKGLIDEIVVVDNYSKDKTRETAKKYGAKIFSNKEVDLGKLRDYGLKKVSGEWVLVLDSDEVLSDGLKKEIIQLKISNFQIPISKQTSNFKSQISSFTGFFIPFQNHFLGRPVKYGGENYKMLRLFRQDSVSIDPGLVHEHFKIKQGKIGNLKHKIYHYSYRSLTQMFKKFTDYAIREAKQKLKKKERTDFSKIFLYPPHMFWARFIKDKGYKDGIFRLPLDLGFAYMEFLTYLSMLFLNK